MDLLEQYKQQNPEAFREKKPAPMADAYGREYSSMTAWVIRLSGGRIRGAKQASYALLGIAIIIGLITFVLFAGQSGLFRSSGKVYYPPPVNTP